MDEVLIHITGWSEMLSYATHERADSWSPPFVNLETARMRNLVWELNPLQFAAYHALIAEYAGAPVLIPNGKVKGREGVPRRLPLSRALRALAAAGWNDDRAAPGALEALVVARLLTLSTPEGSRVDASVVELAT